MNPNTNYGFPGSPHVVFTQHHDYYTTNNNHTMHPQQQQQQQQQHQANVHNGQKKGQPISTPNNGSPMTGPYHPSTAHNYTHAVQGTNNPRFRELQYQQGYNVSSPMSHQQVYPVQQQTPQPQQQYNNGRNNNTNNGYVQESYYGNVVPNTMDNQSRYQNNDPQQRVDNFQNRSRTASKDQILTASSDHINVNPNYVNMKFGTNSQNVKDHGNMIPQENPNSAPLPSTYPNPIRGRLIGSEYQSSPYSSPVKTIVHHHVQSSSPMDSPYSLYSNTGHYIQHPSQSQVPHHMMVQKSPNIPANLVHGSPSPAYFQKNGNSAVYAVPPEQNLVLTPPIIQESFYVNGGPTNSRATHVLNIAHNDVNAMHSQMLNTTNNKIVNPHQPSTSRTALDPYPPFIMLKKPDITIYEIYIEWYYGLNGKEAVYSLNSKGSRWRTRTSADRMFYRKRKTVVDYIILVIRHLKMLYNIHDDPNTIPDNMIDEAVPFQTSVGAATRRNSFTKTEAHEVSDELARIYDKLDLGKDWANIIDGKRTIETTRDINYKGLTSESWHHALVGKIQNTENDGPKIGINCITNPENRLIRGILYELQCALKRKNWSWARFANYLLQIKKDNTMREFDESKEEVDVEHPKDESEHSTSGDSKNENSSVSRKRKHKDSAESLSHYRTPFSSNDAERKTKEDKDEDEEKPSLEIKVGEVQGETAEEKTREEEQVQEPQNKKTKFSEYSEIEKKNEIDNVPGQFNDPFKKDMKIEVDTEILDQSMDTKLMKNVEMPYASSASTPSAISTVQSSSFDEGQERKESIERPFNETEISNNTHV